MNIRKNNGITIITLVITIIVLLIIAGISITGTIKGKEETEQSKQIYELNVIQHAILERYTKAQLTKETLPGATLEKSEVQLIINEINTISGGSIKLKGTEYKRLTATDLQSLGITEGNDTYIVNYATGEVINETKKVTELGTPLYIYAKSEN